MTREEAEKILEERGLHVGDIVVHFKRSLVPNPKNFSYLYEILGFAQHTESGEILVLYKSLYDNNIPYVRPIEMFMSLVDKEKYPNIDQTYRLEKYEYNPEEFPYIERETIEDMFKKADETTQKELEGKI